MLRPATGPHKANLLGFQPDYQALEITECLGLLLQKSHDIQFGHLHKSIIELVGR